MGKNDVRGEAAASLDTLNEVMKNLPLPPEGFYPQVIQLLHDIKGLLSNNKQIHKGKSNDFNTNSHALNGSNASGRIVDGANSAVRASQPDTHFRTRRGAQRDTPPSNVNKHTAAPATTITPNQPAATKIGAKVKFEFVSKDIAEAQNGIIVIMTDANLQQKMPGAEPLAKKFGPPQKATGLEPVIGSIVVQKSANKEIWHLVSKQNPGDKKEVTNKKFYSNHVKALKALRTKMIERNVKTVAITRLGAGYLGVQWRITASKLRQIFQNDDVKFCVYSLPKKVSDLESSAAGRVQGESEASQVAQGVAGGCLQQLPGNPDCPPPQHATPKKVRGEENTKAKVNSLSASSEQINTGDGVDIGKTTPSSTPTTEDGLQMATRQEFERLERRMTEIAAEKRDSITADAIGDMREELRDELRGEIRNDIMGELKQVLRSELLAEITDTFHTPTNSAKIPPTPSQRSKIPTPLPRRSSISFKHGDDEILKMVGNLDGKTISALREFSTAPPDAASFVTINLPPSPSKNPLPTAPLPTAPLPALTDENVTTRRKAKSPKNSLKSLLGMGT
jgi:hypothetical protein